MTDSDKPLSVDFRALCDGLQAPVAMLDDAFRFIEVNRAFQTRFEFIRNAILRKDFSSMYDPLDWEAVRTRWHDLKVGHASRMASNARLLTRRGTWLNAQIQVSKTSSAGKRQYVVWFHDVHEAPHGVAQIASIDPTWINIAESPLPKSIQDETGKIVLVNAAYCRLVGYRQDELIGHDPVDFLIGPEWREFHIKARKDLLSTDPSKMPRYSGVRDLIHHDGRRIPYRVDIVRWGGMGGQMYWCATLIDLSQLVQVQSELAEQNEWLQRIFDAAPFALMLSDRGGNVHTINGFWPEVVGTDDQQELYDFRGHLAAAVNLPDGVLSKGTTGDRVVRKRVRAPGSSSRWLDVYSAGMLSAHGEEIAMTAISDVTTEQILKANLKEGAALQAALFKSVDVGLAYVVGHRIVQINPALLERLACKESDLIGRPAAVLFSNPTDWDDAVNGIVPGDNGVDLEYRSIVDLACHGGPTTCRCEIVVRGVSASNKTHGLLITLTDISELTAQSDALKKSLRELEALIDTEPVGIAHLEDGKIVRVNRAMKQLLARPNEELVGRSFSDLCHADAVSIRHINGERLPVDLDGPDGDTDIVVRAELLPKGAEPLPCLFHAAPIGGLEHRSTLLVAIDLSRQNAAVSMAARMQIRFDTFSGLVNEAIIVLDANTDRVLYANAAVAKTLGLSADLIVTRPAHMLWENVVFDDKSSVVNLIDSDGDEHHADAIVEIEHGKCGRRAIRLRLFKAAGQTAERFVLAEDVTEKRRRDLRQLNEAIAQRDTLVREVHHRIKNNLQGAVGLLQRAAAIDPQVAPVLTDVASQIRTIAHVHGLQLQTGDVMGPVTLVKAVTQSLESTLGSKITVRDEVNPDLPEWGLPERSAVPLALVINEAVTNAWKHGDRDGLIHVVIAGVDGGVSIRISNAGHLAADIDGKQKIESSHGLGLIQALLPGEGATFCLSSKDGEVLGEIRLSAPALERMPV